MSWNFFYKFRTLQVLRIYDVVSMYKNWIYAAFRFVINLKTYELLIIIKNKKKFVWYFFDRVLQFFNVKY